MHNATFPTRLMIASAPAIVVGLLLALSAMICCAAAQAQDRSATFLIYHRFGEDQIPLTNVRLDQFEAHVAELTAGDYHFPSMDEAIAAIRNDTALPARSVVITVDDAYRSALMEAWPRLKAAGIPMTLFVATDPVDQGLPGYLSWTEIRRLHEEGVTIGHHTASHLHMVEAGRAKSRRDIERASERFRTELGFVPELFAYPFGEYSRELAEMVRDMGFKAAFAQYSGGAQVGQNVYDLPRFPFNERYSDIDRFRLIARSRALPVTGVVPEDPVLSPDNNPPLYGFTVAEAVTGLSAINCFPSHLGKAADSEVVGTDRIEVRFDRPFPTGRNRINCTLPGPDGRWYWLGHFFYVPE